MQVAANIDRVRALIAPNTVDAWIFDARSDDVLELLLPTGRFLLLADNIPESAASDIILSCVAGLLTQLGMALSSGSAPALRKVANRWDEVRGIWLLVGYAGESSLCRCWTLGATIFPVAAAAWDTGLVAIFLGLKGDGCEYWGVAIRGDGLKVARLESDAVVDMSEGVQEYAVTAFIFNGVLCQVPDLDSFQKKVAVRPMVA